MSHPKRILLVDDEKSITDLFARALEREGYEVRVVNDPEHAVSAALDFQPELILLDASFPAMEGTEILTQLRQREETALTRVAFFSGKSIELDDLDHLTWFIAKPIRLQAFLTAVEYVLACKSRRGRVGESLAA